MYVSCVVGIVNRTRTYRMIHVVCVCVLTSRRHQVTEYCDTPVEYDAGSYSVNMCFQQLRLFSICLYLPILRLSVHRHLPLFCWSDILLLTLQRGVTGTARIQ